MAVDKLVPSANATDANSNLATNDYTLIDETVASADGSVNDSITNGLTGATTWSSITTMTNPIDSVTSSTFRVRARVVNPGDQNDTYTYQFRCTVDGNNYDITYTDADDHPEGDLTFC